MKCHIYRYNSSDSSDHSIIDILIYLAYTNCIWIVSNKLYLNFTVQLSYLNLPNEHMAFIE